MDARYIRLAKLMLRALALVAREECFALKGGTALNMFIRDVPRLSVDIDLVYVPLKSREETLQEMMEALDRIRDLITKTIPDVHLSQSTKSDAPKLILHHADGLVKIEPNTVLRGTVFQPHECDTSPSVEVLFETAVTMSLVSLPDLYGGKIVAALDRQHPRDLFDIKFLFKSEGLTDDIRRAFVVYLCSHDRSMADILDPHLKSIGKEFESEFSGMTRVAVTVAELEAVRTQLISLIRTQLTQEERKFLLSFKRCEPEWSFLPFNNLDKLPALQWKMKNLRKLVKNKPKHTTAINRLKNILEL